jgi:dTMP kinase
MNGLFIIVEGLDFVGKTTLAKLTAQKLGGIYYNTPPRRFIAECSEIDKGGVNFNQKRFDFFAETVAYASEEIRPLVADGRTVIVDRWIYTTLSYHLAANNALYKKYENNWQEITANFLKPDLSILAYIKDEQVWLNRANGRKASECDQAILNNPDLRKNIFNLFLKFNPDFKLIENSGSIEQSMAIIMDLLA